MIRTNTGPCLRKDSSVILSEPATLSKQALVLPSYARSQRLRKEPPSAFKCSCDSVCAETNTKPRSPAEEELTTHQVLWDHFAVTNPEGQAMLRNALCCSKRSNDVLPLVVWVALRLQKLILEARSNDHTKAHGCCTLVGRKGTLSKMAAAQPSEIKQLKKLCSFMEVVFIRYCTGTGSPAATSSAQI